MTRFALIICWLCILAQGGCSKNTPSQMTRLYKYAEDQKIKNIDQFPLYFRVEVTAVPGIETALAKWLTVAGFRKTGGGIDATGRLNFDSYSLGDTFELTVGPVGQGLTQLHGYGITTSDIDPAVTLRKLLRFLEENYKIQGKELKGI